MADSGKLFNKHIFMSARVDSILVIVIFLFPAFRLRVNHSPW